MVNWNKFCELDARYWAVVQEMRDNPREVVEDVLKITGDKEDELSVKLKKNISYISQLKGGHKTLSIPMLREFAKLMGKTVYGGECD